MKKIMIVIGAISVMESPIAYADHDVLLDQVSVRGAKTNEILPTYPSVTSSVEAKEIAETINAVDTPDVLKYLPNIFVRKRDSADYTGAPIGSRIWGVSYSAKSIVNVDGVPISNQLFNDNTYGTPKWYATSPEEIRIAEVMYGPYSAAYSGNSMGAVVNIATKMPTEFTSSVGVTGALQEFRKLGTGDDYFTGQAHAFIGDKLHDLSWRISMNHQDAQTQPRAFKTGANPTVYPYVDKTGVSGSYFYGATSLIHGISDSVNLKVAYDLTSSLRLVVSPGVWYGTTDARAETYNGSYFGFNSATTASVFNLEQQHYMNSIALQYLGKKDLTWELVASNYYYDKNIQRWGASINSSGSMPLGSGYVSDYQGTQWTNVDWRGGLRLNSIHTLNFGLHYDYNKLNYHQGDVSNWVTAQATNISSSSNESITRGVTQTKAVWAQDVWKISDEYRLTTGIRAERWNSSDGYLKASNTSSNPANSTYDALSPKLSISRDFKNSWLMTLSYGRAARFPTTGELYNVVSGSTVIGYCKLVSCSKLIPPSSNLSPEKVDSLELSFESIQESNDFRVTFFAQDVKDALLSALGALDPSHSNGSVNNIAYYTYWQNIKKVRNYGIELFLNKKDILFHGLDINGSVTYVKSEILDASSSNIDTLGRSIIGHPVPYVPPWRITLMTTYRPDPRSAYTLAARYQKAGASSLDNNDPNPNTYGGFSSYFVVDAKASYKLDKNWRASFGIDNLLNKDYFIYHPFPQRTFIANLKYTY